MATRSEEQFQTLLETLTAANQPPTQNTGHDPTVLGPMRPIIMDTNKMIRLKAFEEWLEEAENHMTFVGTTDDTAKFFS